MNSALIAGAIEQTMTSREIADLTGRRHDQVLRTARELVAEGLTQSVETPYLHEQNGQRYPQHLLNKRDSLVLVARLSPEFTARVIDRWMELEAAAAAPALPNFADPVAAARAWADAKEGEQKALAQLQVAKPALEFVNRYVASEALKGFREVCKLLGAKEPQFRAFLRDERIMYVLGGDWAPYSQHLEAGRFVLKTGTSDSGHAFTRALFTAKGVNWIAGEWAKYQLRSHVPLAQRTAGAGVHA
jgi:phage antirepressor YoqD-like protein